MPLLGFDSLCEERARQIVSRDKKHPQSHIGINNNEKRVSHYQIDGIVITGVSRCDFLLMNEDTKTAWLIELKGSDLTKAARQLENTEKILHQQLLPYCVNYRIVANKCKTQGINTAEFRKYQKQWGNRLKYKRGVMEENI